MLDSKLRNLIFSSLSKSSWAKYDSGWNSFLKFQKSVDKHISLPISIEHLRAYVVWALSNANLKAETVSSYLTGIKLAHILSNLECADFRNDRVIDMCLKGGKNLKCFDLKSSKTRNAFSIHALLFLGDKIASLNWSDYSKLVVWTAATTAFFSSARMGEILPQSSSQNDPFRTLCWNYVKFLEDGRILIFIPCTKTSPRKGEIIDLFPFIPNLVCPTSSLKRLFEESKKKTNFSMKDPVFSFFSGKPLTPRILNEILESLLGGFFTDNSGSFSCHSFRAAIPSIVADYPDESFTCDIKDWGRWKGESFKIYARTVANKRKFLCDKIYKIIRDSL